MNAMSTESIQGDVDTPRPLHACAGRVEIAGWCVKGSNEVPAVRLVTEAAILFPTERHPRPDVGNLACGFTIRGELPSGVYVARLEAERSPNDWIEFRRYSLRVDPAPLAAVLESPIQSGTITERTRPAGWTVHPEHEIRALHLRFGHQQTTCIFPTPREDVAKLFPQLPRARLSGFIASGNIPAGYGPLRVRAELANGKIAVAPTNVRVAIARDENIDAALRLDSPRIPLPGYTPPRPVPGGLRATAPRNVLFLLPGTFSSNNALHAASLANELTATGHSCAIAVRSDLAALAYHAAPAFAALTHADALAFRFPNGRGPDLLHTWTTRESVRGLAEQIRLEHSCLLIVHLEDNEEQLLTRSLEKGCIDGDRITGSDSDSATPDLAHPQRARAFLTGADGVTVITDRLREFVPSTTHCLTLWPAADARFFFPRDIPHEFRRAFAPLEESTVLFYHGNVHLANRAEVRELYAAVQQLNESGTPTTLIRAGLDAVDFLGSDAPRLRGHVLELGHISHHRHLPPLMALADIFVQPGVPDAFNDYRFPSKLPEFFAIGRPVVLPRTNLGEKVRHGIDAYVLDRADAAGIAHAVREIRADPGLATRLAEGAVTFAREHFSWRRSAEALAKFYESLTTSR